MKRNRSASLVPSRPAAAGEVPGVSLATKIFYGFGSIAFGVKDNGFTYFLLIFYNQVIGLPSAMVGLAIMVALVFDAFIDPVVGQWSDHFSSRWGRRHPFMYASAIPLGVSYLLLWNPPSGWGQTALFFYLVAVAVLVRTFVTVYEIPSSALAAELTSDYDERTSLVSYRYLFGWLGGISMYYLALQFFLRSGDGSGGIVGSRAGYSMYGTFSSGLLIFAILVSAYGTHKRIPFLRSPPHAALRLSQLVRELFETLAHRPFLSILAASVFNATAIGLVFSSNLYFLNYFWKLSQNDIVLFSFSSLGAVVLAFALAPWVSRSFEKKPAAMLLIGVSAAITALPILLRFGGLLPPDGAAVIAPLLLAQTLLSNAFGITGQILVTSMIADVVDDAERCTGRRQEGVFFAGAAFVAKAVSGIGIFVSGFLLAAVGFPATVPASGVDPQVLRDFGLIFVAATFVINGLTLAFLASYPLTRKSHEETLFALAAATDLVAENES